MRSLQARGSFLSDSRVGTFTSNAFVQGVAGTLMSNISVEWIFVLCIFHFSQVDFMVGMVKHYVSTLPGLQNLSEFSTACAPPLS